ncbi:MAG TPA: zinc ribbon domain-containing protein [Kiritimatiellia bacterium]|nr:zinc ribbon domain-containing protein [Kiritimatiellia bacterium]HMP33146.1 zinc ribbon domain-containing protein [Kiritimatiellia bacterium]
MAVTVRCQKCGADNRLGQLFCHACGAKLDLSKLTPEQVARENRAINPAAVAARIVRLALFLGLLAVLGLLCWPAAPAGDPPSVNGSGIVKDQMSALRVAIMRKVEKRETFSEADLNAHLNAVIRNGGTGGGMNLQLREVRIDLRDGAVEAWTRSSLGPLTITYSSLARVEEGAGGRKTFRATDARIGHLPLPGPLRDRVVGQLASMFQMLQEEQLLLQRLATVELVDGAVHTATAAP